MTELIPELIIYTPMYVTFFWAVILLADRSRSNLIKKFLGVFMITAFIIYLSHAAFFKELHRLYLLLDPLYIFASLAVYPLYYWYIKLLTVETKINWKNLQLLIPSFVLAFLTGAVYLIMEPEEKAAYLNNFLIKRNVYTSSVFIIQVQIVLFFLSRVLFIMQVVVFLIYGRRMILNYNLRIANFYSELESRNLNWVNYLLYSIVLTALLSIIFNFIGRSAFLQSAALLFFPSIAFSILLFSIGYLGFIQNYSVQELIKDEQHNISVMKEYNQAQLKNKLLVLFENHKIYMNCDLKITDLSEELNTNRTYISNLINQEFSCSFNEFVNRYRLKEAKSLLQDESTQQFSIDYISEAAGFGSVTTFIRAFKESEKTTPGKFREKYLSQSQSLPTDHHSGVQGKLS